MTANVDGLVLGTVNAPWKRILDAEQLAQAVVTGQTGDYLPQLATFFGEVSPRLVMSFADHHRISHEVLAATYKTVKGLTGETNTSLENLLVGLG